MASWMAPSSPLRGSPSFPHGDSGRCPFRQMRCGRNHSTVAAVTRSLRRLRAKRARFRANALPFGAGRRHGPTMNRTNRLTLTTQQAVALDTAFVLYDFETHLQEFPDELSHGAALQLRSAGRLTGLVRPEHAGLSAIVVRLPQRFESELGSLTLKWHTPETDLVLQGAAHQSDLLILQGANAQAALRADRCFALRDGIGAAGIVMCCWAGDTFIVTHINQIERSTRALDSTIVVIELYLETTDDFLESASQAAAAIDTASREDQIHPPTLD